MIKLFFRLLGTLSALLVSLFLLLQLPPVREQALEELSRLLESRSGYSFKAESLSGYLPFRIHLKGLKLEKEGRPCLSVGELEALLSPLSFFRMRLDFERLTLRGLEFSEELQGESSPALPPPFSIRSFSLEGLSFAPEMTLRGSAEFDPRQLYGSLRLLLSSGQAPPSELSAVLTRGCGESALKVRLREPPEGLITAAAGLSCPLPLELSLEANLPLERNDPAELLAKGSFRLESAYKRDPLLAQGNFSLNSFLHFHLHELELSFGEKAKASGSLMINRDLAFNGARLKLLALDLEALKLPFSASGKAAGELLLEGPLSAPSFAFSGLCQEALLRNLPFRQLSAQAKGRLMKKGLQGTFTLGGLFEEAPLLLEGELSLREGQVLELSRIRLEAPQALLSGSLLLEEGFQRFKGAFSAEAADLSLFNREWAGSIGAKVKLESGSRTPCRYQLEGKELAFPVGGAHLLRAKGGGKLPSEGIEGSLLLSAEGLSFGELSLDSLDLSTSVDEAASSWPFHLELSGSSPASLKLISNGFWLAREQLAKISIHRLEGFLEKRLLKLNQPFMAFWDGSSAILTPFDLAVGAGRLTAQGSWSQEALGLDLHAKELPLLPFEEQPLRGELSLDLSLYGTPGEMRGSADLLLAKGSLCAFGKETPPFAAKAHLELLPSLWQVEGSVSGLTEKPLSIKGGFPPLLSGFPPFTADPNSRPLDLRLFAEGELSSFLDPFLTDAASLTGKAELAVQIGGLLREPELQASLSFKEGSAESFLTGASLQQIEGSLRLEGRKLLVEHLVGADGAGGRVSISGSAELDEKGLYPFSLGIAIDKASLLRLDYAQAVASGRLKLEGGLKGAKLTGELAIDRATLTIPQELPALLKTVEVSYINSSGSPKSAPERVKTPWPLELGVSLRAGGNSFVRGRDLSSEWQGGLFVSGSAEKPLLGGSMQLVNGLYNFNGRAFESRRGTISFAGDPSKKTTLYVMAEKEIGDLKVQAVFKGPIHNPTLSFYSNPPLSEREILSWILFGRGTQDITPRQGDQLRQSYFTLSSGRDPGDMLSKIRSRFGIDRVDISSSETEKANEVSVRVGKYLSRGIFVSLGRNITTEANQVAIEAELARHIKAQAEAGDNAEGTFSIKWENSY